MNTQSQSSSYAQTAARITRPTKDLAIVIEAIEGYSIEDYVDGLEKLVNGSDIRFISKISGGRVCAFLSRIELVKQIVDKKLQVKDHLLSIRPLKGGNKRVIVSNVNPVIPDELLLLELEKIGITPVSSITDVKASLSKPGRSHILSFRRQFYLKEEDEKKLPSSMLIHYDDTSYWVYPSTGSTQCHICKEAGHIAKSCPALSNFPGISNTPTDNNNSIINQQFTHGNVNNSLLDLESINSDNLRQVTNDEVNNRHIDLDFSKIIPKSSTLKRLPPPSTVSDSSIDVSGDHLTSSSKENSGETSLAGLRNQAELKAPEKKKFKKSSSIDSDVDSKQKQIDTIQTAVAALSQSSTDLKFVIDFEKLQNFLIESYESPEVLQLAYKYTTDITGLTNMLTALQPFTKKALKARCTRLKKKLLKENSESQDYDSDMSIKTVHTDHNN